MHKIRRTLGVSINPAGDGTTGHSMGLTLSSMKEISVSSRPYFA